MSLNKQYVGRIAKNNGLLYDKAKLAEELGELSAALMQSVTKKTDNSDHIEKEMGDVLFRLKVLAQHYDTKKIHKRAEKKLNKSIVYLNTKRFKKV